MKSFIGTSQTRKEGYSTRSQRQEKQLIKRKLLGNQPWETFERKREPEKTRRSPGERAKKERMSGSHPFRPKQTRDKKNGQLPFKYHFDLHGYRLKAQRALQRGFPHGPNNLERVQPRNTGETGLKPCRRREYASRRSWGRKNRAQTLTGYLLCNITLVKIAHLGQ